MYCIICCGLGLVIARVLNNPNYVVVIIVVLVDSKAAPTAALRMAGARAGLRKRGRGREEEYMTPTSRRRCKYVQENVGDLRFKI